MKTKTDQLKQQFSSGNLAGALKIFKTFKIGITPEEQRTVEIAYEAITGKEQFYQSLGINTDEAKEEAIQIINLRYFK